ncbi:hypothetical protein CsatB_011754 [Cannabis sativa]
MFDLLMEIRHKLSKEEFEEVIKILWAIWENRNKRWNNLPVMEGARLIDWVLNSYPTNTSNRDLLCTEKTTPATNLGRWLAPPKGCTAFTVMQLWIMAKKEWDWVLSGGAGVVNL